jgi:hypothetical protein
MVERRSRVAHRCEPKQTRCVNPNATSHLPMVALGLHVTLPRLYLALGLYGVDGLTALSLGGE